MSSVPDLQAQRPYWLLIAVACIVPAILDAFKAYMMSRASEHGVDWSDVVFSGTEWIFLGVLTPIAYVLSRRFPLRPAAMGRAAAAHSIGALTLCFGWASMGVFLGWLLDRYPYGDYPGWLLTSLPWSVFMYFTVLGCVYAFTYHREAREREKQLAEARLSALRMQLHPHFLFNSLNAITVLVRDQKTQDASRMLELLSGMLRRVFQSGTRQEVTVEEELKFIEQYLAIEQIRFSDRLRVDWSMDSAVGDALVPEFILQPLVENAVRHGIAKRAEAGRIEIVIRESERGLVLTVGDNGPGYRPERQTGVGLANTRARLETLYAGAASLDVQNAPDGGTVATIRLPLKRSGNG
jgi:signal transduction histidine kinase